MLAVGKPRELGWRSCLSVQQPDRNLALELVRVTEAAALAAGRWMGRGDKNGPTAPPSTRCARARHRADGRHRRHRRGREGRGADALQRRARSATARRPLPTSPSTRSTAPRSPRSARANAIVGDRGRRARHDVRPRPVRLHGEDRGRAGGGRRRSTSPRRRREPATRSPKAKGETRARRHRRHPRPRPPRATSSPRSARRAPASGSSPTATSPARSPPRWPDAGADILFGIGGTPEGVIAAAALKCMGGEIQGRLWPRDDDERDGGRRRGLRPRPRPRPPTTSSPATTASSRPPASPTASC